jgi:hypothetical protein
MRSVTIWLRFPGWSWSQCQKLRLSSMVGANLGRRGPSLEMAISSNAQSSCREGRVHQGWCRKHAMRGDDCPLHQRGCTSNEHGWTWFCLALTNQTPNIRHWLHDNNSGPPSPPPSSPSAQLPCQQSSNAHQLTCSCRLGELNPGTSASGVRLSSSLLLSHASELSGRDNASSAKPGRDARAPKQRL